MARRPHRRMAFERITVDPGQMAGLPCIRGMRSDGQRRRGPTRGGPHGIDEVLVDYPYLEREDVLAALEYAAAAVSGRESPSPPTPA